MKRTGCGGSLGSNAGRDNGLGKNCPTGNLSFPYGNGSKERQLEAFKAAEIRRRAKRKQAPLSSQ